MPIFEFRCADCNTRFEELLSSSSATAVSCPSCHSGNVQKLLSVFAASSSSSSGGAAPACSRPGCGSGFS